MRHHSLVVVQCGAASCRCVDPSWIVVVVGVCPRRVGNGTDHGRQGCDFRAARTRCVRPCIAAFCFQRGVWREAGGCRVHLTHNILPISMCGVVHTWCGMVWCGVVWCMGGRINQRCRQSLASSGDAVSQALTTIQSDEDMVSAWLMVQRFLGASSPYAPYIKVRERAHSYSWCGCRCRCRCRVQVWSMRQQWFLAKTLRRRWLCQSTLFRLGTSQWPGKQCLR